MQDYLYLQVYNRVTAFAITRSSDRKEMAELTQRLTSGIEFLEDFIKMHNMTLGEIYNSSFAPTSFAYTRHYLSIGATGTLPEIITLMLPCLWIYDDIEKKMNITFGPYPKHTNQENHLWLKYNSITKESGIEFYRAYLDAHDKDLIPGEEDRLLEIFVHGVVNEYMFWQMSWTKEQWILEMPIYPDYSSKSVRSINGHRDSQTLSQRLRDRVGQLWDRHFSHPFLTSLANGTLAKDKFEFYVLQDILYLQVYNKITAWATTRTKDRNEMHDFGNRIAIGVEFLEKFITGHNIKEEQILSTQFAPTNYAYTRHLLSIASNGSLMEIITSQLLCLWIYDDIETRLNISFSKTRKPRESDLDFYRSYIDTHENLLKPGEEDRLQEIFTKGVIYEYMFWDMAWNKEQWNNETSVQTDSSASITCSNRSYLVLCILLLNFGLCIWNFCTKLSLEILKLNII